MEERGKNSRPQNQHLSPSPVICGEVLAAPLVLLVWLDREDEVAVALRALRLLPPTMMWTVWNNWWSQARMKAGPLE